MLFFRYFDNLILTKKKTWGSKRISNWLKVMWQGPVQPSRDVTARLIILFPVLSDLSVFQGSQKIQVFI